MFNWSRWRGICPQCKKEFELTYGVKHVYCSDACKQKAYRERKKALRLSAGGRNGGAA